MATDATGTASTNYSIPKYLTSSDKPSGKGLNAIVDFLDTLFAASGTLFGAVARSIVAKAGVTVGTRRKLNFIEGSNITLTIADDNPGEKVDITIAAASNNITVATTVAGLGAGAGGKVGRLRIGSSPYEFVDLVYDSTYSKWVSAPVRQLVTAASINTASATYVGSASENPLWLPNYKALYDAGLRPQLRWFGTIRNNGGSLGTGGLRIYDAADGDTADGTNVGTADCVTTTSVSNTLKDSGWIDPSGLSSPASKADAKVVAVIKAAANTTSAGDGFGSGDGGAGIVAMFRWVA